MSADRPGTCAQPSSHSLPTPNRRPVRTRLLGNVFPSLSKRLIVIGTNHVEPRSQRSCVGGRTNLNVIVEVDVHIAARLRPRQARRQPLDIVGFPAMRPSMNATGPCFKGVVIISTDVKLVRTMKAAVNEIRGNVHNRGHSRESAQTRATPCFLKSSINRSLRKLS